MKTLNNQYHYTVIVNENLQFTLGTVFHCIYFSQCIFLQQCIKMLYLGIT